jgi:2,4-dienoyl-CoA reductase (NADPH2)
LRFINSNKVTEKAIYYAERIKGGVSLIVTGGISPNIQGWTATFTSVLKILEAIRDFQQGKMGYLY